MPFDSLTMAAVSDELRANAVGSRIQKIIQPSSWAVALSIYGHARQRWLLLSADPRFARAAFTQDRLAKAFPTPSPFVMLLRKHLEGARVLNVTQMPYERILVVGTQRARLVVEVMGKHSNVILVSDEQRILGALKSVPSRESRVRPILAGREYQQPPPRMRDTKIFPPGTLVNPYLEPELCAALLRDADPIVSIRAALLGVLAGCGPFLAEEIGCRAGASGEAPLSAVSAPRLLEAARSLFKLYETREWEPATFQSARGKVDFAPYIPSSVDRPQPAPSMSAAIESAVGGLESRDALQSSRATVRQRLGRAINSAERRIASLASGLEAADEADQAMQAGQTILAYQHLIRSGTGRLEIPETGQVIPLDPRLGAVENAERYFRRYRKLRDARRRIPPLLLEARTELDRLQEIDTFVALAETEADLQAVRRELEPEEPKKKQAHPEKRGGRKRYTWEGYSALVGRTARENEEVTFRLAARDDLWLHARGRAGAHVVLRGPGEPGQDVLHAAAGLAGYFSSGRSDTAVDVDVARVRDVRKVAGGPPGKVTYRNFRTVRVPPSLGQWRPS